MLIIKEKLAKSILCKSGITDYTVNCYTGCQHACVYCYARFMKRFTHHPEPWGQFVDIKINAAEILAKEVQKKPLGEVFMSSVCDGWQPLEKKHQLTRQCLRLLVEKDFPLFIFTKSSLVTRDFDLLEGYPHARLGIGVSTLDEELRPKIEPLSSPPKERIAVLEKASKRGIRIWALFGPFIPFLTDTEENLEGIFSALAHLPLEYCYIERLNARPDVQSSVRRFLYRHDPRLLAKYQRLMRSEEEQWQYIQELRFLLHAITASYRLSEKCNLGF